MEPTDPNPFLTLEEILGDTSEQIHSDPKAVFGDFTVKEQEEFSSCLERMIRESETARQSHVGLSKSYREADRMKGYDASELITPGAQSVRTPLTLSRIDQAHSSVFGALALNPFWAVATPEGEGGSVAHKFEIFMGEEFERAEGEIALRSATRDPFVVGIGYLKAGVVPDEEGHQHLDVQSVAMEDVFLNPHDVRDLAQCSLVAQRYFETYGTVLDMAHEGYFDLETVKKLTPMGRSGDDDGGAVDREFNAISGESSYTESRMVELLECYMKHRRGVDATREMYRAVICKVSRTLLRLEKWDDGFPLFPVRHEVMGESLYGPSFAAKLRDLQYINDMLISAAFERDRMALNPLYVVSPYSTMWDTLKARQEETGTVYMIPGEVLPGNPDDIKPIHFDPAPPMVQQRMGLNQQMADAATVPNIPMQTTRAATEIRFAAAQINEKEQAMLKSFRRDLTRFGEYCKRLAWKYICPQVQDGGEGRFIPHGSNLYGPVSPVQVLSLRVTPRGMTTRSDKVLQQQSLQMLSGMVLPLLEKKQMYEQAGLWPQAYAIMQYALELSDIQDFQRFIGVSPIQDPLEHPLDPQAGMRLAALRAGQNPMDMGGFGQMGGMMSGTENGPAQGLPQNTPMTEGGGEGGY